MIKEAPGADHPNLLVRKGSRHLGRLAEVDPPGCQQQLLRSAVQPTGRHILLWPQIKITH
jgi:hypothetical protein